MLYEGDKASKLGTVTVEPNVAKVFEFEISGDSRFHNLSLGMEPRKGNASLCGLTVERINK
jgi:hypothetical protein